MDSRYLIIDYWSEIFIIDVTNPKRKPKRLLEVDGGFANFAWSKDMKKLMLLYFKTGRSIFKPMDFFVVKVDLSSGAVKTLPIDGLLYDGFYWVDENTVYYNIDHVRGLFQSKLKW